MNGQAKIDFEKWLCENYNDLLYSMCGSKTLLKDLLLADHIKNTDKLLNNVKIEWFDTIGIYIGIEVYRSPEFQIKYEGIVSTKSDDWYLEGQFSEIYSTRQQATEKALEKAIILYNEKFKENE